MVAGDQISEGIISSLEASVDTTVAVIKNSWSRKVGGSQSFNLLEQLQ